MKTNILDELWGDYFKTNLKPKVRKHRKYTHCRICENKFDKGDIQIDHYCKLTGDYLGVAHEKTLSIVLLLADNINLYTFCS